ncbi:hypothetical protein TRICI_001696 [Trichomonascus ciferrii]|uniref:Transcription elongation factor Eaf N-terminal domain-containing protein n=1 Tax=Trichomonascus ciferrii TaxID=44093 RepID=A0A642V993_9ASCO|nr:hypothetical protein TRICI_001696 [Trichomonascus ciferrii]
MNISTAQGEYDVRVSKDVLSAIRDRREDKNKSTSSSSSSSSPVFSVRYNFRPDSLDTVSPAQVSRDRDEYVIEAKGTQSSQESHMFRGQASAAKESEYVLVFDPDSQTFELQPLDFTLRMNSSREKSKKSGNGNSIVLPSSVDKKSPSPLPNSSASSRSISPDESRPASQQAAEKKATPAPATAQKAARSSSATSNNKSSKPRASHGAAQGEPKPSTKKPTPASVPAKPKTAATAAKPAASAKAKPSSGPQKQKQVQTATPPSSSSSSVAQKKPPSSSAQLQAQPQPEPEIVLDDDDDEDLLGALANELEESLEDDTKQQPQQAQHVESEESDEDEEMQNNVVMIEPSNSKQQTKPSQSFFPKGNTNHTGPISLKGYVGNRPEEEDLSSSEEE